MFYTYMETHYTKIAEIVPNQHEILGLMFQRENNLNNIFSNSV
jgi:hypothetical protein